jgi:DNA-binding NtrC family response regulator
VRTLVAATAADAAKDDRPYSRIQREFSGKVIVESLRYTSWKLRPAARLLGVSPVKLRQDFRAYLELLLAEQPADLAHLAKRLEMPERTLRRKLHDLGIDLGHESTSTRGGAA